MRQIGFYSDGKKCPLPPEKDQGLMAEMVKSTLCSGVKLCALTFTRVKLDVALHSIQNINLSQNMAATSFVKSLHTLSPACITMTMSA